MLQDNFQEKQIGVAYWFVTHKLLLKNIFIVFFIISIVFLVSLNLYLLIFNLGIYRESYQKILKSLVTVSQEYVDFRSAALPRMIQVSQISKYSGSKGFDIVASVINPNKSWYATFDYQFALGDNLTAKRSGFILPGENKSLVDLSVDNGNLASDLKLTNLIWTKAFDFSKQYAEKYSIELKDIKFVPTNVLGVGDKVRIGRAIFTAVNKSVYNYTNVNFLILLKAGEQVAAVNQISSGPILSGQSRVFEANFFQSLPTITSITVIPEINILDSRSFLKY